MTDRPDPDRPDTDGPEPDRPATTPAPSASTQDGGTQPTAETPASRRVGTALIDGATFLDRPVTYGVVDGMAVVEGDIVLGTVEEVERETRRREAARTGPDRDPTRAVGISGSKPRWPNTLVPYDIDAGLPNQKRVTDAVAHWEANTPVRFVLRTTANQAQYPDFVRFAPGSGCSSSVGRRGGQQTVTLGSGCSTGSTIHEIGHVVGLWHEQSREDRDNFVTINSANITSGEEHNFDQHITDGDDIGGYDYGSIMHYGPKAFSSNGLDTITPRQTGVTIGQRTGLSAGDIAAALALYSPDPDGRWSQWFGLGGVCSAVSVVRADDVTDIYVRGQDGTLFQKWWDGQRWNPGDTDFAWHGDDFRMLPNSLSVIAADGFRDVYAIGLDGQLCHKFWTRDGGWSQWFGLGGVCSAVAVAAAGDKTDMYVRGQDGTLFQKWWDGHQHLPGPSDYYWHGAGLRMAPRALSVIGWKGFRDVYALDQNGQLCHKFFA